ncbi:hypothetical protein G7Y89_g1730 [Cudoniella acicularis]|uniref:J domain-containing protein n=1 Tax=Cudoniella acicularis TaxID=354080 RepID=A0A8H4W9Z8_9HELO|nr:hypothetical protein G7Y89_g1730 [Cudoniella acicularis]
MEDNSPPSIPDYYSLLGIPQTSTPREIKQTYLRLAFRQHPDKNGGDAAATAAFQLLAEAKETLIDEPSRRIYDIRYPSIKRKWETWRSQHRQEDERVKAAKERAEAEQKEREARMAAAAEERARAEREAARKRQREELQGRWRAAERRFDDEIFEVNRKIRRLDAELAKLRTAEKMDEERVLAEKFRRGYDGAFPESKIVESQEEKAQAELERLRRSAAQKIKKSEVEGARERLDFIEDEKQKQWEEIWAPNGCNGVMDSSIKDDLLKRRYAQKIRKEKAKAEKLAKEEAAKEDVAEFKARWEEAARRQAEYRAAELEAKLYREKAEKEEVERVHQKLEAERLGARNLEASRLLAELVKEIRDKKIRAERLAEEILMNAAREQQKTEEFVRACTCMVSFEWVLLVSWMSDGDAEMDPGM